MSSHIGLRSATAENLIAAVASGEFDRADALLSDLRGPQCDEAWRAIAELHTARHRWDDACDAILHIRQLDQAVTSRLTLCRNLAALKIHRPQTYRCVIDAEATDAYRIHHFADGQQTIICQPQSASPTYLSFNPAATVISAMKQLQPICNTGQALALLSVGDGHVLAELAKHPPKLFLDREQAIFIFEPDARLMLAVLLMHDFTGPTGPIEQPRVRWYVGERWANSFRVDVLTDRFLPFPQTNVKLGVAPQPIEAELSRTLEQLGKADAAAAEQVAAYYAPLSAEDFRHAIAGEFGRPPRVLLLTTRLSTVLQYSTRDSAEALRRLGWDAHVCIEPTPYHVMSRVALRRTLAEFKPDVVFQIDHNRFEHGDMFPSNLPFVNWIQDLLPNLMNINAGKQIGERDFVLTPSLQRWADNFAYPPRQCMEFRKLSRVPQRPISWHSGDDLVYVSNWSQRPEQIRDELLGSEVGTVRDVTSIACDRMIALYARGGTLHTFGDVRDLLNGVTTELDLNGNEVLIRKTTTRLFDRMNNVLYRQQGLMWAKQEAKKLGLKLCIYGNGWEKNPDFAANARGPVGYGEPLEELTRSAGANLVLEPFVCIAHQRLLDALTAGGFCLVRDTPGNALLQSLIEIVAGIDPSLDSVAGVRAALKHPAEIAHFDRTIAACTAIEAEKDFDHIANTRRQIHAGFVTASGQLLPSLDKVLFDSPEQLHETLVRFTRDEALRGTIARQQRQAVEQRYSYGAGMARMAQFITARLADERQTMSKAA